MIILTAAFPFVPAELNIAHFASTYIPADITCRLLQTVGEDALLVSATDYHSIYASANGVWTERTLCDDYHEKYQRLYSAMSVKFDRYITTEEETHRSNVIHAFLKMKESGLIYTGLDNDFVCEHCGCSLPERFVKNTTPKRSCPYCGGTQIARINREHYFLKIRDSAAEFQSFSAGISQDDVRNIVMQFSCDLNDDWDITRYNHLGITVPEKSDQSFYIWFDSLIGYYSLAGLNDVLPERMIHFIGKNIIYHHTVLWRPIASALMGRNTQIDISARGFLNFDKTDVSMIDPMLLSDKYEPDFIRFYIAFKVKDSIADYSFTEDDFVNIVNHYCCRTLGGFFYKVWYATKDCRIKNSSLATKSMQTEEFIKEMRRRIDSFRIHDALRLILKRIETVRLQVPDRNKKLSTEEAEQLLYDTAVILSFLSCYMPSVANKYSIFEDWVPSTVEDAGNCCLHNIKRDKELVKINAKQ